MTNWQMIKEEYLAGGISYCKLAAKYGVSQRNLEKMGSKEGWVALRRERLAQQGDARNAERTHPPKQSEGNTSAQEARTERLHMVADKLLGKIEEMVDAADPELMNPTQLRALSAVIKDLKQIQGIQSPLDIQEQMMRIEKLRRQAEQEDQEEAIEVVFAAGQEEWNG